MLTSDVKTVFRLGGKFIPSGTKVSGAAYVGQPGKTVAFKPENNPFLYAVIVRNNLASGEAKGTWDPGQSVFKPDLNIPLQIVSGGMGEDCEGVELPKDPSKLIALYEFSDENSTHRCVIATDPEKPYNGDFAVKLKPGSACQTNVYDEQGIQYITIDNPGGTLKISVIALE